MNLDQHLITQAGFHGAQPRGIHAALIGFHPVFQYGLCAGCLSTQKPDVIAAGSSEIVSKKHAVRSFPSEPAREFQLRNAQILCFIDHDKLERRMFPALKTFSVRISVGASEWR
jgi:hypothetical protein